MMDMKRQLAVSQQETQMLQKRLAGIEATTEKLTEENKKLQVKKYCLAICAMMQCTIVASYKLAITYFVSFKIRL